jgi:hypothetical protein
VNKYLSIFLLTISFVLTMTLSGYAFQKAPTNVILEGNANGLVTFPDEKFLEHLNMMPGDKESGVIDIYNSHDKPFELYIKAKRITPKEEYDLLDKIDLKITYKDELLYNGPVSGENDLEEDIYLGTFNEGETAKLVAEIELDGPTTTNDYKNKTAQVDWIFTALTEEEGAVKPGNPNEPNDSDNKPGDNILDNNTGVSGDSPKTGDNSIFIYVILFVASFIVLISKKMKLIKK